MIILIHFLKMQQFCVFQRHQRYVTLNSQFQGHLEYTYQGYLRQEQLGCLSILSLMLRVNEFTDILNFKG